MKQEEIKLTVPNQGLLINLIIINCNKEPANKEIQQTQSKMASKLHINTNNSI
jgi:hypothetical protein